MKRAFVSALMCFFLIFCSCSQKVDVGALLAYMESDDSYELVLSVGESKYDMTIALEPLTGEYPYRDAQAVLSSGVLEGVAFKMNKGELVMKIAQTEYGLEKEYAEPLCAVFGAFAIEQNSFNSVTSDAQTGEMTAVFDGVSKYTVYLSEPGAVPRRIIVQSNGGAEYIIDFKG